MNNRITDVQRWIQLIQEQEVSGLNVKEFCRRMSICKTSFYTARRRFNAVEKSNISRRSVKPNTAGFIRITPPIPVAESLRVETPNGYVIDMGRVNAERLQGVLKALQTL